MKYPMKSSSIQEMKPLIYLDKINKKSTVFTKVKNYFI